MDRSSLRSSAKRRSRLGDSKGMAVVGSGVSHVKGANIGLSGLRGAARAGSPSGLSTGRSKGNVSPRAISCTVPTSSDGGSPTPRKHKKPLLSADELRSRAQDMTKEELLQLTLQLLENSDSDDEESDDEREVHPSTLLEITELMTSEMALPRMMSKVVSALSQLIRAEQINFWSVDTDGVNIICDASTHPGVLGSRVAFTGIVGYVVKTGRVVNVDNVTEDWRYEEKADNRAGLSAPMVSVLTVPVRGPQGRTIAVLEAINTSAQKKRRSGRRNSLTQSHKLLSTAPVTDSGNGFSQDDEVLLTSMASLTSLVLNKSTLDERVKGKDTQTQALHLIATLSSNDFSLREVSMKIMRAAHMTVNAESVLVYIVDDTDHHHELVVYECGESEGPMLSPDSRRGSLKVTPDGRQAGAILPGSSGPGYEAAQINGPDGIADKDKEWFRIPLSGDKSFVGHAAVTGKAVNVASAGDDWRHNASIDQKLPFQTVSVLAIPVTDYLGKAVAVIEARNKRGPRSDATGRPGPFSGEDEQRLSSLASISASVIRQAQLYWSTVRSRENTKALLNITELMSAELGTDQLFSRIIQASYRMVNAERLTLFIVEQVPVDTSRRNKKNKGKGHKMAMSKTAGDLQEFKASIQQMDLHSLPQAPGLDRQDSETRSQGASPVLATRKRKPGMPRAPSFSTPRSLAGGAAPFSAIDMDLGEFVDQLGGVYKRELVCRISKDADFVGKAVPWGSGIVGHVALTCKSLNIPDAQADPRFDPSADKQTGFKTKSILTVPVTDWDGRALAVIQAVNKKGRRHKHFTREDQTNLESLGLSAGIILRKSQAYEAAVRAEKKSRSLLSLLKVSSKEGDLEETMNGIVSVAYDILQADRVTIFFVHKNEMFSVISKDGPPTPFPVGQGIAGHVALTGVSVNVADARTCDQFDPATDKLTNYKTRSVLCMPVKDQDNHVLAVVQAINKKAAYPEDTQEFVSFTREDQILLEAFCTQIRTTIRRHLTEAMLRHLNVDDSKVQSLVDLYTDPRAITRKFTSAATGGKPTARPQYTIPDGASGKLDRLQDTSFNVWEYTEDDLMGFTLAIFKETGMTQHHNIDLGVLGNWVLEVRRSYRDNPFHNWYHGFSVLHFTYLSLKLPEVKRVVSHHDALALLVASLCHDIDHPGNTNTFEINTMTDRALQHNDISVLENHHAFTTFRILRQARCNIFEHMNTVQYRQLRSSVIEAILATDMGKHFGYCKELEDLPPDQPFDPKKPVDRQHLINIVIHSSDLSGQVFPTPVARQWEERISQEFNKQATEEKALGMEPAPFMQGLDNPIHRAALQVKFIDFILMPWWDKVVRLFPSLAHCNTMLQRNRDFYHRLSLGQSPSEETGATEGKTADKGTPAAASAADQAVSAKQSNLLGPTPDTLPDKPPTTQRSRSAMK